MILLQTISVSIGESIDYAKWIEVGAIIISPVITILIWQLNNKDRRKLERINTTSRLSGLLFAFYINFKETETQEIRYQTAYKIDKEKFKDDLKHLRLTLNSLNKERAEIKAEITEEVSKLSFYISNDNRTELRSLVGVLDKLVIRRFVEDFKNIESSHAEVHGKELEKKMNDELSTVGCLKVVTDITKFLKYKIHKRSD